MSWYGGKNGRRIIDRFLDDFDMYLKKNGRMYMLQSSLSDLKKTIEKLKEKGFRSEILKTKKLFFEELIVIKAERDIINKR